MVTKTMNESSASMTTIMIARCSRNLATTTSVRARAQPSRVYTNPLNCGFLALGGLVRSDGRRPRADGEKRASLHRPNGHYSVKTGRSSGRRLVDSNRLLDVPLLRPLRVPAMVLQRVDAVLREFAQCPRPRRQLP